MINCVSMLSALCQRVNGLARVKSDQRGPLVSETKVNPVLTSTLTRCGARSRCLGVVQLAGVSANDPATSAVAGIQPAATKATAGARRG